MKVLKIIKNTIIALVGTVYFVFALAMTVLLLNYNEFGVTQFGSKSLVIINDDIANENYKRGDLAIVEKIKVEKIQIGDEICTYRVDSTGVPHIQIGKVGAVYEKENTITFENGENYGNDFIAGKNTKIYDKLGTALSIIESKWGFLFIVLVPCFLIFIYELYSLIIEIKYGAQED